MSSMSVSDISGGTGIKVSGANSLDYCGNAVSDAGDLNGDGYDDFVIGCSLADRNNLESSGAAYVLFGSSAAANLQLGSLNNSDGFMITGGGGANLFGSSISSLGDVNGDGLDDVLIGAYGASDLTAEYGSYGYYAADTSAGRGYIVFGSSSGFVDINLFTDSQWQGEIVVGANADDWCGFSVGGLGDINGDGLNDMVFGAPNSGPGHAYVVFGKSDAPTASPSIVPTVSSVVPTVGPTEFASSPSGAPTSLPTSMPTSLPTSLPTSMPTLLPTMGDHDVYYLSDLSSMGYIECLNTAYSDVTTDATLAMCSDYGVGSYFVGAIYSTTAEVNEMGAFGSHEIFTETSALDVAVYDSVYGKYWYNYDNFGFGFSPTSNIILNNCDSTESSCDSRLCWNLDGHGGFRAGCATDLTNNDHFRKVVYVYPLSDSFSFRYFKLVQNMLRGGELRSQTCGQLGEFIIGYDMVRLDHTNASATSSSGNPEHAIDNDFSTVWCDTTGAHLVIDFGATVTMNSYTFVTGNGGRELDMIEWVLYGSDDASTWYPLSSQSLSTTAISTSRGAMTSWFGVSSFPTSAPTVAPIDPLCSIIAATNIESQFQSPEWSCLPDGSPVSDPCSGWSLVVCSDDGKGVIIGLFLDSQGLTGTIASEIGSLTSLIALSLNNNSLTGMDVVVCLVVYLYEYSRRCC